MLKPSKKNNLGTKNKLMYRYMNRILFDIGINSNCDSVTIV